MDWARAIERNSEALKGILAALFAMLGLEGSATLGRIPKALHASVLRLLRPAESAMRRLIVIAVRGLQVKLRPSRPMPAGLALSGKGGGRLAFQLFDRRKRFGPAHRSSAGARALPRIHIFNASPLAPVFQPVPKPAADAARESDGLVDAQRLGRRLEALKLALGDLPRQARRLARWRAKRDKVPSLRFKSPLRPGRPPGHRRHPVHEVDEVLRECHGLAHDALAPDTS